MKALWVALPAVLLAGCLTTGGYVDQHPVPIALSEADKEATKKLGIASLKDPDSAKFGDKMARGRAQAGWTLTCGMVNAKNGFGGYSGMEPFAVQTEGGAVKEIEIASDALDGSCSWLVLAA